MVAGNESVGVAVESVVLRAMAKQPDQRPSSATALFDELAAAVGACAPVVVLHRQGNGRRHVIAPE